MLVLRQKSKTLAKHEIITDRVLRELALLGADPSPLQRQRAARTGLQESIFCFSPEGV